jgi:hypothetical protein
MGERGERRNMSGAERKGNVKPREREGKLP